MDVAVLIDRNRLGWADDGRLRLIGQIYADTTALGLHIDEGYMVLGEHRMGNAADLNLYGILVYARNYGDMLLATRLNGVGNKLLHLLAAAYHCYTRIYDLLYYITAMAALKKLCHISDF